MIGARGPAALGGECVRHRPALLDLLEDPLGNQLPAAARTHLDGCGHCRSEMADAVLMGLVLRRTLADARDARPPADGWPRLRTRIERQRATPRPGLAASPVAGVALAASIAIALLVPLGLPMAGHQAMHEAGVDPAAIRAAGHREAEAEARQQRATILAGKEASSNHDVSRAREELIRQEVAPVREWRAPIRSPFTGTPR